MIVSYTQGPALGFIALGIAVGSTLKPSFTTFICWYVLGAFVLLHDFWLSSKAAKKTP